MGSFGGKLSTAISGNYSNNKFNYPTLQSNITPKLFVSENIIAPSNATYTHIYLYLFSEMNYENRAQMNLHVSIRDF